MMGFNAGAVVARFRADVTHFKQGVAAVKRDMAGLRTTMNTVGSRIATGFKTMGANMVTRFNDTMKKMKYAALIAGAAMGFGLKKAFSAASDFEQSSVAFVTLFRGNAEKAQAALKGIEEDAKATPFNLADLVKANQMLISTGMEADQSRSMVKNLGDAVSATGGDAATFNRMIANLQQIKNLGKASAMDIKQFGMAGINIYQMLADTTGKSVDELKDMDISYDMLEKSFAAASAEGGQFHDAMRDQSKTFQGLKSNLEDVLSITAKNVLIQSGFYDVVKGWIGGLTAFIEGNADKVVAWLQNFATQISAVVNFIKSGDTNAIKEMFGMDEDDKTLQFLIKIRDTLISWGNWIVENKETVIEFLKGVALALGGLLVVAAVTAAFQALTNPVFILIVAIGLLYVAWQQNMWGIQEKTATTFGYINTALTWIKEQWDAWGKNVFEIVKNAFMLVFNIIKMGVQMFTDTITIFILFFSGEWKAMWFAIQANSEHTLNNLKNIFHSSWEILKNGILLLVTYFTNKFEEMWQKAKDYAEKIRHAISDAFDKDKHNSPSISDKVNDLKSFVEKNQFGFTPNITPAAASTVNQTINAELGDGVDIDMLGERMRFLMRSEY